MKTYSQFITETNKLSEEDEELRAFTKDILDKHDTEHKSDFQDKQQHIQTLIDKLPENPTDEHHKFIGNLVNKLRIHPYLRAGLGGHVMTPYDPEDPVKLGKEMVDQQRAEINDPLTKIGIKKRSKIWE